MLMSHYKPGPNEIQNEKSWRFVNKTSIDLSGALRVKPWRQITVKLFTKPDCCTQRAQSSLILLWARNKLFQFRNETVHLECVCLWCCTFTAKSTNANSWEVFRENDIIFLATLLLLIKCWLKVNLPNHLTKWCMY